MSTGKELAKNTLIISIGKICTQMVSFFLLPLYTKLLSTEEYGTVDLVVTYGQLLLPIITCQLEQAVFRFLIDKRKDEMGKKEILSCIFSATISVTGIFVILYLLCSPFITSSYKYLLLINLLANAFSAMMLQTARGFGKNNVYAMGSFISASGQVCLNILFVAVLRLGADGMITAMILSHLISGLYIMIAVRAYHYIKLRIPKFKEIKPYVMYSLPLVPNAISWWILSASDRTVILHFLGVSYNGIYSAGTKFSGLYNTIFNIFNLSWTETVSLHMHESNSAEVFTKLQSKVLRIFSSMYLGIVAIMPFVFPIMINEKFKDAYNQIPILMLGAFFCSLIGISSAFYIADKNTKTVARTSISCALLNIMVDILLITHIGLYAAPIATAVAYLALYLIRYFDIRKQFGVKIEKKLIISVFIATVIDFMAYYSKNMHLCLLTLACTVLYALIINRELVKDIILMMKNASFLGGSKRRA